MSRLSNEHAPEVHRLLQVTDKYLRTARRGNNLS